MNQEITKLEKLCNKYGYQVSVRFDTVYIRTLCESWYFELPTLEETGMVKLYHGNSFGNVSERYHKQFTRKITMAQLVTYIHDHELAKYMGCTSVFTYIHKPKFKNSRRYARA
uniref:hypothetical protein n=1 Tax=Lachnoclostridium phocaeense TaxID=1871021 RepID=UPI0026DCACE0|nr:hypothetical protein [Lachnoclostridium phocaeense]